jgi:hypothetical protein
MWKQQEFDGSPTESDEAAIIDTIINNTAYNVTYKPFFNNEEGDFLSKN